MSGKFEKKFELPPNTEGGEELDAGRLLAGHPEEQRAAEAAEIATRAGDLVRRLRGRAGLTQAAMAALIGSTQAHISELERGLGTNGPTVNMLARIFAVLGDNLVIESATEQAALHNVWLFKNAPALTKELAYATTKGGPNGLSQAFTLCTSIYEQAPENPCTQALAGGWLAGLSVAADFYSSHSSRAMQSATESVQKARESMLTHKQVLAPFVAFTHKG